jgi:hypothetical protein
MSTNVGTLQAPRAGGSILLAGFLALLVMLTIAVVAISINQGEQAETTQVGRSLVYGPVGGSEQTFGSRGDPAAVRQQYGIVGGTAANTPSELNPVYMHGRNLQGLSPLSDALGTTTPTERSGGIIGGLPAKFYDRHQRG